jgi:hypothetical protein
MPTADGGYRGEEEEERKCKPSAYVQVALTAICLKSDSDEYVY